MVLIKYPLLHTLYAGRAYNGTDFFFGNGKRLGKCDTVVGTSSQFEVPSGVYVVLEPPSVDPRAYTYEWREGKRRVISFAGPWLPNVVPIRSPWPFGWPELPDEPYTLPWDERIDGVIMVAGAKGPVCPVDYNELYTRRFHVAMALHNAGVRVDWYGRPGPHGNTAPGSIFPWYCGEVEGGAEQKRRLMSKYRFALCWENWAGEGYVTEKLPDALSAGCIPLYRTEDTWVHQYLPRQCRSHIDALDLIREFTASNHARFVSSIDLRAIRAELDSRRLLNLLEETFKEKV